MLMRYTYLGPDGEYKKKGNEKLAYATMTYTRVALIHDSAFYIANASIIGVRYGAFRRQFRDEKGQERLVLDYHAHLDKLSPLLAASYAQVFGFYFI